VDGRIARARGGHAPRGPGASSRTAARTASQRQRLPPSPAAGTTDAGGGRRIGLRGWSALATAHGALASAALLAFLGTGWIGRRLERGDRTLLEWHARLAALAVLLAAASIGTGLVLLP